MKRNDKGKEGEHERVVTIRPEIGLAAQNQHEPLGEPMHKS